MLTVKSMTEKDIASIEKTEKECFNVPWTYASLYEELSNDNSHFFVAFHDDSYAGYIGSYTAADECYIENLAVDTAFRNKGTASQLINTVIDYAKTADCRFVSLEVRPSNSVAAGIYKKAGFKEVGIRKKYYHNPEEDALIMTLFLKDEEVQNENSGN